MLTTRKLASRPFVAPGRKSSGPLALSLSALLFLMLSMAGCADTSQQEPAQEGSPASMSETQEGSDASSAASENPVAASAPDLLDPNEATREELLDVPNIDEGLADTLLEGRPYGDMLEVDAVLATELTEEERTAVYTTLWKPLDLNAATGEEILLIPGVGERMEHEFEEYRPYRAMEEFRREIGKYVDEEEVARLEQYVMIP